MKRRIYNFDSSFADRRIVGCRVYACNCVVFELEADDGERESVAILAEVVDQNPIIFKVSPDNLDPYTFVKVK